MKCLHAGLAASANVAGVSLGGILGHCMCTGGAVLGGRQLAAYVAEQTLAVSTATPLVTLLLLDATPMYCRCCPFHHCYYNWYYN